MADQTLDLRPSIDIGDPGEDDNIWGQITNDALNALSHATPLVGDLAEIQSGGQYEPGAAELDGDEIFFAKDQNPTTIHRYDPTGSAWETVWDGTAFEITGNVSPSGLSVTDWNVIDVANHGYDGTRSGDLTTLFEQNPDSVFVLQPGGEYEMSKFTSAEYSVFGLICPGEGNPPDVYAANPSKDSGGNVLQNLFFELGDHGSNGNAGTTIFKNIRFRNSAGTTSADGWRYDHGLFKCVFDDYALIENVEFPDPRHRIEDNGDGTQSEHGARYQNRIEGGTDDAQILINGFRNTGGGTQEAVNGAATGHAIGFAVEEHYGHMTMKGVVMDGYVDNGFYTTFTVGDGHITQIGCTARNCANSNFRPGPNHTLINCRVDLIDTAADQYQGIALHLQDGENANVNGFRIFAQNHDNDIVRLNNKMSHAALRNVWITNKPGTGDGSVNVLEAQGPADQSNHGITLEDWLIDDEGDDNSKPAPLNITRDDLTLRRVTVNTTMRHGAWVVGNATFDECAFNVASGKWSIRMGDYTDNTNPSPDGVVRFNGCRFIGGDGLQSEAHVDTDTLEVRGNDFTGLDSGPYTGLSGHMTAFIADGNAGALHADTTGLDADSVSTDRSPEAYSGTPAQAHEGQEVFRTDLGENGVGQAYRGGSWYTKQTFGERVVLPSESIQTALNDVGPGGVIRLLPDETYDEGAEITTAKGQKILANGAIIEINGDHHGIFMDNEVKVLGYPDIRVTDSIGASYTSNAVLFHQGRCTDGNYGYGADSRDPARIEAHVESVANGGTGVFYYASSGGIAFTEADISVRNFASCLKFNADPADSHINANRINASLMGGTNIVHVVRGTCRNEIYGRIQCATGGATDRAFYNEDMSGNVGPTFYGQVWDTFGCNVSSIEGNDLTIVTDYQNAHGVMSNVDTTLTDPGPRSKVYGVGQSLRFGNVQTGEMWEIETKWDGFYYSYYDDSMSKTDVMKMNENGVINAPAGNFQKQGNFLMANGDNVNREVYVNGTEPSGWVDGDLWFQPQ